MKAPILPDMKALIDAGAGIVGAAAVHWNISGSGEDD